MPELPEVETVARGLAVAVPGRTIRRVRVLHPRPLREDDVRRFTRLLAGARFADVLRRGKYIVAGLSGGLRLVTHLRMTGKYIFLAGGVTAGPPDPHTRVVFEFTDGAALLYRDPRLFGTLRVYGPGEPIAVLDALGPEPFDPALDAAAFHDRLVRRRAPLKVLLLDQRLVAGIGNIYASEALFQARLSPRLPGDRLERAAAGRLLRAVRDVLRRAIRLNGTTIGDFRSVDDKSGGFQAMLRVYGREGQACRVCRTPIVRTVQSQRSTFHCPRCQPEPSHSLS